MFGEFAAGVPSATAAYPEHAAADRADEAAFGEHGGDDAKGTGPAGVRLAMEAGGESAAFNDFTKQNGYPPHSREILAEWVKLQQGGA